MSYQPNPIDTSAVSMPSELSSLSERLAENAHDRWAQVRLGQGWTLGPVRSDALKQHPGLIAYDELSEDEKDLDRATAEGTLLAILALGYQIIPPAETSG